MDWVLHLVRTAMLYSCICRLIFTENQEQKEKYWFKAD